MDTADYQAALAPQVAKLLERIGWEDRFVRGQIENLNSSRQDPNTKSLVVIESGELIAYVTATLYEWNSLARIHGLAVDPDYRRRRLATGLIAAIEEFIRQRGGRGVYVDTPVDNEPAIKLYESCGFSLDYRMTAYYGDDLDGVTLVKFFK
jgi:ribosomal protein S18 acetylase RimI-like enzyme